MAGQDRKRMVVEPIMDQVNTGKQANMDQLFKLYRVYVCDSITGNALELMRERELRRYVAMGMHKAARSHFPGARHAILVRIISKACGVAEVSVYQWVAGG